MSQLALPLKSSGRLHSELHQFRHNVARVHVDGAQSHDFLPLLFRKLAEQQRNQRVQLRHLQIKRF
jgi:hypothetical protein